MNDERQVTNLPPELQQFAALFDAQTGSIQVVFQYCLCLLSVAAGKMHLVETIPGEVGQYVFLRL